MPTTSKKLQQQLELAWAAGLFDGEGCTSVNRKGDRVGLRINIGQRDRYVLDRFKQAVGRGKIHGPDSQSKFVFRAGIADSMHIMTAIWPWLSPIKQEQFIRRFEAYALQEGRKYGHKNQFVAGNG